MKKKTSKNIKLLSTIIAFFILVLVVILNIDINHFLGYSINDLISESQTNYDSLKNINEDDINLLKVYFVDIGQGDSIIINKGNESMIIDAGPNSSEEKLINYINTLKITRFKYVVRYTCA